MSSIPDPVLVAIMEHFRGRFTLDRKLKNRASVSWTGRAAQVRFLSDRFVLSVRPTEEGQYRYEAVAKLTQRGTIHPAQPLLLEQFEEIVERGIRSARLRWPKPKD